MQQGSRIWLPGRVLTRVSGAVLRFLKTAEEGMMPTIVITSASRGIGLATAVVLARAGHSVIAIMRDPAGCPELSSLRANEGLPLRTEQMDVDSDASVAACFAE